MKTMHSQRGMSYWAVMFGIILVVMMAKGAMAVWPAYWDNRIINDIITERLKVMDEKTPPDQLKRSVSEQFDMNNIRDLKFDDIAQVYSEGSLVVETDYEIRRPFIGNIDIVVSFKKRFDQKAVRSGE